MRRKILHQWRQYDLAKQLVEGLILQVGRNFGWACLPALLIACTAAGAWSEGGRFANGATSKTPQPIRIEKCTIKSLKEVVLAFDRAGILGKLDLHEGDAVESGQFLAGLKDDVARAALAVAQLQADSEVEIVYAELAAEVAKIEHEKMLEGNRRKPGAIAELEVRRARLNHDKTRAEVDKARQSREVLKAKRDEAAAQLDTYRLEAPFDGFITRMHLIKGASVKQGDPVIELVNTRQVKVEGYVLARDAASIPAGSNVEVRLENPGEVGEEAVSRTFPGKIVFVDVAKVTALGSKVRVWAEVENPEMLLRAGLTATMTIQPIKDND